MPHGRCGERKLVMWSGHSCPLAYSIGKFSEQSARSTHEFLNPESRAQMPKAQRGFSFGLGLQ